MKIQSLVFSFHAFLTHIAAEAFSAPLRATKAVVGRRSRLFSAVSSSFRSMQTRFKTPSMALSAASSDQLDSGKSDGRVPTDSTDIIPQNSDDVLLQTSVPTINSAAKMTERVKYFIYVDPLDDFGAATVAKEKCEELGVKFVAMWCPKVAQLLLAEKDSDTEEGDDVSSVIIDGVEMKVKDIENDAAPRLARSKEFTPKEIATNWLKEHGIEDYRDVLGVLCESDIGLKTAEEFSSALGLATTNNRCEGRRDKFMQQDLMRQEGLSVVNQILTDDWAVAKTFLLALHGCEDNTETANNEIEGFSCVIKPCRGSASFGVTKASSLEEAERMFRQLLGFPGFANGTVSDAVLVQETLHGEEFAIDTVSRSGEHKIVASWKYDKRILNDAPFVYFCTELVSDEERENNINRNSKNADKMQSVYAYAKRVLDALDVKWGPTHLEIMVREADGQPVLVEANVGRWHGQDVTKMSEMAYGFDAVQLTMDAMLSSCCREDEEIERDEERERKREGGGEGERGTVGEDRRAVKEEEVQKKGTPSLSSSSPPPVASDENQVHSLPFKKKRSAAYERWLSAPDTPYRRTRCAGRVMHLVSAVEGILKVPPRHLDRVDPPTREEIGEDGNDALGFSSLFRWAGKYNCDSVGEMVEKTIDLHTTAGYALLIHPDKATVDSDYRDLVELQTDMYDV